MTSGAHTGHVSVGTYLIGFLHSIPFFVAGLLAASLRRIATLGLGAARILHIGRP